jgi:hypothetical protein
MYSFCFVLFYFLQYRCTLFFVFQSRIRFILAPTCWQLCECSDVPTVTRRGMSTQYSEETKHPASSHDDQDCGSLCQAVLAWHVLERWPRLGQLARAGCAAGIRPSLFDRHACCFGLFRFALCLFLIIHPLGTQRSINLLLLARHIHRVLAVSTSLICVGLCPKAPVLPSVLQLSFGCIQYSAELASVFNH